LQASNLCSCGVSALQLLVSSLAWTLSGACEQQQQAAQSAFLAYCTFRPRANRLLRFHVYTAGVGMRARAGYIYIRGEFVNERKAVMRAIGAGRGLFGMPSWHRLWKGCCRCPLPSIAYMLAVLSSNLRKVNLTACTLFVVSSSQTRRTPRATWARTRAAAATTLTSMCTGAPARTSAVSTAASRGVAGLPGPALVAGKTCSIWGRRTHAQ